MPPFDPADPDDFARTCGRLPTRAACRPVGIDPVEREVLDTRVRRRRRLIAGEGLFREGDPCTAVHVARSGTFKATATDDHGDARVLGVFLPGELLGLDGLGHAAHRCDAVALEPAEVGELDFHALMHAAVVLPGLRGQLQRLVDAAGPAASSARRTGRARVAAFLDDLVDRTCRLGQQGTAFRLPMERADVAAMLGLDPDTFDRALARLQAERVLDVRRRQVDVLDAAALARVASGR